MTNEREAAHQRVVREEFTRQADTYSTSARVADPENRRAFVDFVSPPLDASALDIATGPGFMAFALAERVGSVTGIDITPAMLARAEAERIRLGLTNVRFQEGDVTKLPFPDASFDVAVSGLAFHHFPNPAEVMAEAVRVLRPGGRLAISDLTTSDDPARAELHNRIESLRDPSHTRALPVGELAAMGGRCGLTAPRIQTMRQERALGEWTAITNNPPETVEELRRLLTDAVNDDAAGIGVWLEGDEPHFWHTRLWFVAIKPLAD